ncbi:glycosyltransferase [Pseudomonas sp.]|uniref:glycosyltransferase n=1 Tax=Pseudomonas sp. TaxID=306 RepID=UPI0028A778AF|nr:glycosyltransferase [Pseudomonas sp.]
MGDTTRSEHPRLDVLNVMWSGGSAFVSVQKVHRDILKQAGSGARVESLLLQAGEAEPLTELGPVSSLGLNADRIKGRGPRALRRWLDRRCLRAWIAERRPRVVLLDGIGVAAYVLPLLRMLEDTRAVILFHGAKRLRPADIRLVQGFDAERLILMAVSGTLAADSAQQIGRPVSGCRVAIEPVTFRSALLSRDAARAALGLVETGGRTVGAVGRLVPDKGFELLVRSIADWLLAHPQDQLVIVGDGVARPDLLALARELGVAGQVHLVGHQPVVPRLYRAFDLVCIPSKQEGLGLVLPEAVIAGVPVLASDLPVFHEQLSCDAGLLPSGDAEAWRRALAEVLGGSAQALAETQQAGLAAEAAWLRFVDTFGRVLAATR